jgi:hypothetical protein
MTDSLHSGFEFVIQDPNERFSKETQTIIRKRAMHAVGAARRRSDPHSSSSPTSDPRRRAPRDTHPLPPMPISGLELLVRDSGLDPIDLSALASVHIGAVSVTPDLGVLWLCILILISQCLDGAFIGT